MSPRLRSSRVPTRATLVLLLVSLMPLASGCPDVEYNAVDTGSGGDTDLQADTDQTSDTGQEQPP